MTPEQIDPPGLIRESYRIDGITAEECRSIFLDWAIRLPQGTDTGAAIRLLLETYAVPDHPMTRVLNDGLVSPHGTGRRGGARGRRPA